MSTCPSAIRYGDRLRAGAAGLDAERILGGRAARRGELRMGGRSSLARRSRARRERCCCGSMSPIRSNAHFAPIRGRNWRFWAWSGRTTTTSSTAAGTAVRTVRGPTDPDDPATSTAASDGPRRGTRRGLWLRGARERPCPGRRVVAGPGGCRRPGAAARISSPQQMSRRDSREYAGAGARSNVRRG